MRKRARLTLLTIVLLLLGLIALFLARCTKPITPQETATGSDEVTLIPRDAACLVSVTTRMSILPFFPMTAHRDALDGGLAGA